MTSSGRCPTGLGGVAALERLRPRTGMVIDSAGTRWLRLRVLERHEPNWQQLPSGPLLLELLPGPAADAGRVGLEARVDDLPIGLVSPETALGLRPLVVAALRTNDRVFVNGRIVDVGGRVAEYSYEEDRPIGA